MLNLPINFMILIILSKTFTFFTHVISSNFLLIFKLFFYQVIMLPSYVVRHWFITSFWLVILRDSCKNVPWIILTCDKACLKSSISFEIASQLVSKDVDVTDIWGDKGLDKGSFESIQQKFQNIIYLKHFFI